MAAVRVACALLLCALPLPSAPAPATSVTAAASPHGSAAPPPAHTASAPPRYSARIVHTKYGAVRGVIVEPASRRLEPVEAFLGVPYAAQPERLAPPAPPPISPRVRLADSFAPVCPQPVPDIHNETAALEEMPLGVYNELREIVPLLANQSEDCLYLNIYVPGSGSASAEAPFASVMWLGGGGGGAHGSLAPAALHAAATALAASAHLVVLTPSYRIGLLGYLTPSAGGSGSGSGSEWESVSGAGGAALLDIAASLRWWQAAARAFGADPLRTALAGHGAAAALANAALALPLFDGLVSRLILLSGSALAPSAYSPDPALVRRNVADALHCEPPDNAIEQEDWLVSCVRARPLAALVSLCGVRARFVPCWAPAAPRRAEAPAAPHRAEAPAAPHRAEAPAAPRRAETPASPVSPAAALHRARVFLAAPTLIALVSTESYPLFSEREIRDGFEEEHRNRILRTFVRNVFRWHRNEIYAAARNEYTDWEKPIQHPINIRDAALEALSDAAGAAPALRLAALRASRGAITYLAHLAHHGTNAPQRLGSVPSESLAMFMGLPLVGAGGGRNYTRADVAVAETCVALLGSFVKHGEPTPRRHPLSWPNYDMSTQQYLSIGSKLRVRSHYRGHKMALWLHLVPQLHRPGASARHHRLRDTAQEGDMFTGEVFPEWSSSAVEEEGSGAEEGSTECAPPSPEPPSAAPVSPAPPDQPDTLPNIDSHYYSYSVALGVTVGAGCSLLALNVLVFAGIYLQRGRRQRHRHNARSSAHSTNARTPRRDESTSGYIMSSLGNNDTSPTMTPQKSSLKRSSETELKERPFTAAVAPPKKRVQIQEISV